MAQPTPQAHHNPGCCFSIKHSDACHHIKEGTLLITAAIAAIAVVGAVLAVLSMNGVNLGPLNSITNSFTSLVGEKYIYIGLTAGAGVLLIDTVLIAALIRSYYNKQYTQREIDNFGLGEWLAEEDICEKLEPGQYWRFPKECEEEDLATETDPGHPAVWGFIVKNLDGGVGVYAFKTEENMLAQIHRLGYIDGDSAYNDSTEYTHRYVEAKIGPVAYQNLLEVEKGIGLDEYIKLDKIKEDEIRAYPLLVNRTGRLELHFYKNKEARNDARTGLFNRNDIKRKLKAIDEEYYLSDNSAWVFEKPFRVRPYNKSKVEPFVVAFRPAGKKTEHELFPTAQEAQEFVQLNQFDDAKEAWNHESIYPSQFVHELFDDSRRPDITLQPGEIATFDLILEEEEGDLKVFALKIKNDSHKPSDYIYFKSKEARENHIQNELPTHTDPTALYHEAGKIIDTYQLQTMLQIRDDERDCFVRKVTLHGLNRFIVLYKDEKGIQYLLINSHSDLQRFLHNKTTLKNITDRFTDSCPGQFESGWVLSQLDEKTLEPATEAAEMLEVDQYEYGSIQTPRGIRIYWLASKEDEEAAQLRYFASDSARSVAIDELDELEDLNYSRELKAAIEKFKDDQLLEHALANENDCWGTQLTVSGKKVNVLYVRTESGIEIDYPTDLTKAKRDYTDVEAQIRETGEFPVSLGQHLNQILNIMPPAGIHERFPKMLPKESWWFKPQNDAHPKYGKLYMALVNDSQNDKFIHYFSNERAREIALNDYPSSFSRDNDIQDHATNLAKAANATSRQEPVPHVLVVTYENVKRAAIVTVSADGRKTKSEYVSIDEAEQKIAEKQDYKLLNTLFADLGSERTKAVLDVVEKKRLDDLLGNRSALLSPGSLKNNHYKVEERLNYTMLVCINEDGKKHGYFPNAQAAREYARQQLKGSIEQL